MSLYGLRLDGSGIHGLISPALPSNTIKFRYEIEYTPLSLAEVFWLVGNGSSDSRFITGLSQNVNGSISFTNRHSTSGSARTTITTPANTVQVGKRVKVGGSADGNAVAIQIDDVPVTSGTYPSGATTNTSSSTNPPVNRIGFNRSGTPNAANIIFHRMRFWDAADTLIFDTDASLSNGTGDFVPVALGSNTVEIVEPKPDNSHWFLLEDLPDFNISYVGSGWAPELRTYNTLTEWRTATRLLNERQTARCRGTLHTGTTNYTSAADDFPKGALITGDIPYTGNNHLDLAYFGRRMQLLASAGQIIVEHLSLYHPTSAQGVIEVGVGNIVRFCYGEHPLGAGASSAIFWASTGGTVLNCVSNCLANAGTNFRASGNSRIRNSIAVGGGAGFTSSVASALIQNTLAFTTGNGYVLTNGAKILSAGSADGTGNTIASTADLTNISAGDYRNSAGSFLTGLSIGAFTPSGEPLYALAATFYCENNDETFSSILTIPNRVWGLTSSPSNPITFIVTGPERLYTFANISNTFDNTPHIVFKGAVEFNGANLSSLSSIQHEGGVTATNRNGIFGHTKNGGLVRFEDLFIESNLADAILSTDNVATGQHLEVNRCFIFGNSTNINNHGVMAKNSNPADGTKVTVTNTILFSNGGFGTHSLTNGGDISALNCVAINYNRNNSNLRAAFSRTKVNSSVAFRNVGSSANNLAILDPLASTNNNASNDLSTDFRNDVTTDDFVNFAGFDYTIKLTSSLNSPRIGAFFENGGGGGGEFEYSDFSSINLYGLNTGINALLSDKTLTTFNLSMDGDYSVRSIPTVTNVTVNLIALSASVSYQDNTTGVSERQYQLEINGVLDETEERYVASGYVKDGYVFADIATFSFNVNDNPFIIESLAPNTNYRVRVRNVTSDGPSPWSNFFPFDTFSGAVGDIYFYNDTGIINIITVNNDAYTMASSSDNSEMVVSYEDFVNTFLVSTKTDPSLFDISSETHLSYTVFVQKGAEIQVDGIPNLGLDSSVVDGSFIQINDIPYSYSAINNTDVSMFDISSIEKYNIAISNSRLSLINIYGIDSYGIDISDSDISYIDVSDINSYLISISNEELSEFDISIADSVTFAFEYTDTGIFNIRNIFNGDYLFYDASNATFNISNIDSGYIKSYSSDGNVIDFGYIEKINFRFSEITPAIISITGVPNLYAQVSDATQTGMNFRSLVGAYASMYSVTASNFDISSDGKFFISVSDDGISEIIFDVVDVIGVDVSESKYSEISIDLLSRLNYRFGVIDGADMSVDIIDQNYVEFTTVDLTNVNITMSDTEVYSSMSYNDSSALNVKMFGRPYVSFHTFEPNKINFRYESKFYASAAVSNLSSFNVWYDSEIDYIEAIPTIQVSDKSVINFRYTTEFYNSVSVAKTTVVGLGYVGQPYLSADFANILPINIDMISVVGVNYEISDGNAFDVSDIQQTEYKTYFGDIIQIQFSDMVRTDAVANVNLSSELSINAVTETDAYSYVSKGTVIGISYTDGVSEGFDSSTPSIFDISFVPSEEYHFFVFRNSNISIDLETQYEIATTESSLSSIDVSSIPKYNIEITDGSSSEFLIDSIASFDIELSNTTLVLIKSTEVIGDIFVAKTSLLDDYIIVSNVKTEFTDKTIDIGHTHTITALSSDINNEVEVKIELSTRK